ncbi:MAG: hypothetical protein HDS54_02240 [Barnesiella sp.]|nr:hypothetical protein [Barnesiella sp.]
MTAKLMAGKVFEKILRKNLHNSKNRFTFANANGKEVNFNDAKPSEP